MTVRLRRLHRRTAGFLTMVLLAATLGMLPSPAASAAEFIRIEDTDSRLSYRGTWSAWTSPALSGGSYRYGNAPGTEAVARFAGTGFEIVARIGPEFGIMRVVVDGGPAVTVDLYAATTGYQHVVFTSPTLASGDHTVRLEWTGTKNAASRGTFVSLDALGVVGTPLAAPQRYEESDGSLEYQGSWSSWTNANLSGGTYRYANRAGASVSATFDGTRAVLVARKGPEFGIAKVVIDDSVVAHVDLYSPSTLWREEVFSSAELPAGQHTLRLEWTGNRNDASTNTYVSLDALDVSGTLLQGPPIEETNVRLSFSGAWQQWSNAALSGGGYRYGNAPGTSVVARFNGTRIEIIGRRGPEFGKALISIDGVSTSIDLYSPTTQFQQTLYVADTLEPGTHTMRLSWTGTKNAAASGTYINIDAMRITGSLLQGPARVDDADSRIACFGTWTSWSHPSLAGGSYRYGMGSGTSALIRFNGTRLDVLGRTGPEFGQAKVTVDGVASIVDFYVPETRYQQPVFSTGELAEGDHTITIEWTGDKNAAATGTYLCLDALDVVGTLLPVPGTTAEQGDPLISRGGSWTTTTDAGSSGGSYAWTNSVGGSSYVSFTGRTISLSAVRGPDRGIAEVYLDGVLTAAVDLYSPTVLRGTAWSYGTLSEGDHTLLVRWSGRKNPRATAHAVTVDAYRVTGSFKQATTPPVYPYRFEDDDTRISYAGAWTVGGASGLSGGQYRWTGAIRGAALIAFEGTSLTWLTATGPLHGLARVTVDGTTAHDVNLYAAVQRYQQPVWSTGTLASGRHTVLIEWTGQKDPLAGGAFVGLDAVQTDGVLLQAGQVPLPLGMSRVDQAHPNVTFTGAWSSEQSAAYVGGTQVVSRNFDGNVQIAIDGSRIDWFTTLAPTCGMARIYLDGLYQKTVDLYSPTYQFQQFVYSTGELPSGRHILRIEWAGTHNANSTDYYLCLDGFDIRGTLVRAPGFYEEWTADLGYQGLWEQTRSSYYSGGSHTWTNKAKARLSVIFEGTQFAWNGEKTPSSGLAEVTIDDRPPVVVDLYSPSNVSGVLWQTDVANGPHLVTIECLGTKSAASSGTRVAVDSIQVTGMVRERHRGYKYEQTEPGLHWIGGWFTWTEAPAAGGSFGMANSPSSLTMHFNGTQVAWVTTMAPHYGIASVRIDGGTPVPVDLFAETVRWQETVWESPRLAYGTHTITIEWTGLRNQRSVDTYIGVDVLEVTGPLPAPRASLLTVAAAQLGKPYVWAGAGPSVFDCSGLVQYVYRNAQFVSLPHYSGYQYNLSDPKYQRWQDLLPGDLVFATDPSDIHHVGIYIGNGMTINAPQTGRNVEYRPVTRYGAFGRVPPTYWRAPGTTHIVP